MHWMEVDDVDDEEHACYSKNCNYFNNNKYFACFGFFPSLMSNVLQTPILNT